MEINENVYEPMSLVNDLVNITDEMLTKYRWHQGILKKYFMEDILPSLF